MTFDDAAGTREIDCLAFWRRRGISLRMHCTPEQYANNMDHSLHSIKLSNSSKPKVQFIAGDANSSPIPAVSSGLQQQHWQFCK